MVCSLLSVTRAPSYTIALHDSHTVCRHTVQVVVMIRLEEKSREEETIVWWCGSIVVCSAVCAGCAVCTVWQCAYAIPHCTVHSVHSPYHTVCTLNSVHTPSHTVHCAQRAPCTRYPTLCAPCTVHSVKCIRLHTQVVHSGLCKPSHYTP